MFVGSNFFTLIFSSVAVGDEHDDEELSDKGLGVAEVGRQCETACTITRDDTNDIYLKIMDLHDKMEAALERLEERKQKVGPGASAATGQTSTVSVPPKVDIPTPKKFSGQDADVDVRLWMRNVERHLTAKSIPKVQWGDLAFSFLEGTAAKVWDTELVSLGSYPI